MEPKEDNKDPKLKELSVRFNRSYNQTVWLFHLLDNDYDVLEKLEVVLAKELPFGPVPDTKEWCYKLISGEYTRRNFRMGE